MTSTKEALEQIRSSLNEEMADGRWVPQAGDFLEGCAIVRAGFRAWGLEAADHSWRLNLSRLDFGDSNPSALLTVYAPNHAAAFGDLDWFAFSHSVGANGGTNFNQAIKRLHSTLGGSESDWTRALVYLIAKAKQANAGANNGTFFWERRPAVPVEAPPFAFFERIREGRTVSIFGPGSAGKSTLVDGLLVSACSGLPIIPGWRPTRRYRCLTLDWDEGREEVEVRLAAICNAYDADLTAGYHYKRMSRPLYDVADEVGAYIVNEGIELVAVTPVGRSMRDHKGDYSAPVEELYEILRGYGTTNILVDHVAGEHIRGGAEREFGGIRKRDNARGSFSLYAQSEEVGQRVVVIRNTKPDAMSPKLGPQAIRIEYDPPAGRSAVYDRITFHPDEVDLSATSGSFVPGEPMRIALRRLLRTEKMTAEDMAEETGFSLPSIRACLHRYKGNWFGPVAGGKWEILPGASEAHSTAT